MPPPEQRVDATWTIASFVEGSNDREVGCPSDWLDVKLVTADAKHPDVQTVDRFRCADGAGTSSRLEDGSYTSWLEFLDATGTVVATSLPSPVDIGPYLTPYASKIYVNAGYASLTWSIAADRCEQSAEPTYSPLSWIYLKLTGPTTETSGFTCDAKHGVAGPLLAGRYSVWIGQGVSGNDRPDIVIEAANHVTDLPPEQFQ